tara:strand:+ start:1820 stop:2419 length:600 start_codon:yes stop_codon:yes gene_type:complete
MCVRVNIKKTKSKYNNTMNTEQYSNPAPAPSRTSSKYGSKQPSSSKSQTIAEPLPREVKIADILPVVLSAGILVLLYFMMKEYSQDKKNTEVHLMSISKRLEQLETTKSGPLPNGLSKESPPVPPENLKVQFKVPETPKKKQENAEILEPDNKGTFEMKDSVVSFVPNNNTKSESKAGKMSDIDEDVSEESESETDTEM